MKQNTLQANKALSKLLFFQRVPHQTLIWTAVTSALLGTGMYYLGQPLYMIALYAMLPWMPIMLFEGIWKIKHYHWFAIFAAFALLQIGHVMEHIVQVGALLTTDATLSCPPPEDTAARAQLAVDAALRDVGIGPTGRAAAVIIKPDGNGQPMRNSAGGFVSGPPACGIFGQLDLEIVHLVWEVTGWILSLVLVVRFPHSKWMWLSIAWASFHTVEHLFISYTFFLDPALVYEGTRQIWGTLADGNLVTAYPLGREKAMLTFYDVSGKFGIAAKNGLIGSLLPSINPYLPTRPFLHLYYNLLVTVPSLLAFITESRKVYDRHLRKALPELQTQEMVAVTAHINYVNLPAQTEIIRSGEEADSFYIITKGRVEVLDKHHKSIAALEEGDYFGEIGLLYNGKRCASVNSLTPVELIQIDRLTFDRLLNESADIRKAIEQITVQRLSPQTS